MLEKHLGKFARIATPFLPQPNSSTQSTLQNTATIADLLSQSSDPIFDETSPIDVQGTGVPEDNQFMAFWEALMRDPLSSGTTSSSSKRPFFEELAQECGDRDEKRMRFDV